MAGGWGHRGWALEQASQPAALPYGFHRAERWRGWTGEIERETEVERDVDRSCERAEKGSEADWRWLQVVSLITATKQLRFFTLRVKLVYIFSFLIIKYQEKSENQTQIHRLIHHSESIPNPQLKTALTDALFTTLWVILSRNYSAEVSEDIL